MLGRAGCHDRPTQCVRTKCTGTWDGTDSAEISGLLQKWENGDYEVAAPQGESPFTVETRSVSLIYDLISSRPEANLVFVLHGYVL